MEQTRTERSSTIELLRIGAMLCIIMSHYSLHGAGDPAAVCAPRSLNRYFLENIVLGDLGTDIFVMISGYFGVRTALTGKRLLRLWGNVWTYSVLLYGAALLLGWEFRPAEAIGALMPVIFNRYWFVTAYLVLLVLTPYINRLLCLLPRAECKKLVLTMLLLWCGLQMIPYAYLYGSELPQFVMLYCVGAYIRLYPEFFAAHRRQVPWCLAFCLAGLFGGSLFLSTFVGRGLSFLFCRTSVLMVGIGACLLLCCQQAVPFYSRTVNTLAGSVFSVYLIHEHPQLRELLWGRWLPVREYADSPYLVLHMMGSVLAIFAVCVAIDQVKQRLIDRPAANWLRARAAGKGAAE